MNPTTAIPASDFLDTIGVNGHLGYDDTGYGKYDEIVKPRLTELGVRHWRDGLLLGADLEDEDSMYFGRLRDMAGYGVQFDLVLGNPSEEDDRAEKGLGDISSLDERTGGAVVGVEGLNEPDLQLEDYDDWAATTERQQKQLYETVRSEPSLDDVAVLGPTPIFEAGELADLGDYADGGSVHNYYAGRHPDAGPLEWETANARLVTGDKPIYSTETGYHSAMATTDTHLPTPENIIGRYLPRVYLTHFLKGVRRTYMYEFLSTFPDDDTEPEANFGLLRSDGTPRPSFFALKNLIDVLGGPDGATVDVPRTVDFRLDGDLEGVKSVLLERADGQLVLALWLETSGYDPETRKEVPVESREIAVVLADDDMRATATHRLEDDGSLTSAEPAPDPMPTVDVSGNVLLVELQ